MKKFKIQKILIFILPIIFLANSASFANKDAPEDIILSAANNLFSDVEKNKKIYEEDISAFYERVDNILSPIIDFDVLIKSIIGKNNYKNTSDDLRNRFKIALKNQLIRIYAKTIVEYSNSNIKIISTSETKGFYLVKTELSLGKGKPPFQVIYVIKKSSENWKIV